MEKNRVFLSAIHEKKLVNVMIESKEKGTINRICVPFDFGPSRRYRDGLNRYHFYDLDSPEGSHNLSILPNQLLAITLLNQNFDPKDYVTFTPNWFVSRDWGIYS